MMMEPITWLEAIFRTISSLFAIVVFVGSLWAIRIMRGSVFGRGAAYISVSLAFGAVARLLELRNAIYGRVEIIVLASDIGYALAAVSFAVAGYILVRSWISLKKFGLPSQSK